MPAIQTREIAAAQRLDKVRYAIRDLALVADEVTRQGHTVLSLNVGDPNLFDFETPPHLIDAVYRAMKDNKNGYAPSPGVSEAVDICLSALINPGEHILTPSPNYPLYSAVLSKLGIPITTYDLKEHDGWQPDLVDIQRKITSQTRAIVLINPNNPTGSLCSRRMLERLAELARQHNLVTFADEIYDKLILDEEHQHLSLAAVAPDLPVVTFGGLSKNYLAPGWRIGWGMVSGETAAVKPYIEGIHRLLQSRLCANHPEQYAIKPALDGPQDHLIEVCRKLRSRRDLTVNWANSTPRLSCAPP